MEHIISYIVFNGVFLQICFSLFTEFKSVTVLQGKMFTSVIVKSKTSTSTLGCATFCFDVENPSLTASICDETCYCFYKPNGTITSSNCTSFEYRLPNPSLNCFDIYTFHSRGNGIYNITVNGHPLQVYCDMNRGGWTVLQRRLDGSLNFFRHFSDYQIGFGSVIGEHWLGLDNIHDILSSGSYEVRLDLEDFNGNTKYAEYSTFNVADSSLNYTLEISGYRGDAGDGMLYHNGMMFSAVDVDNDIYNGSCASSFKGGWWYTSCHTVNINGIYNNTEYGQGLNWYQWHGFYYSLKSTSIKIRPRK